MSETNNDYQNPVCGITGKEVPWSKRTWISVPINGKFETIPLYLDIDAVRDLHRQSPTYIAKKNTETVTEQELVSAE